MLTPDEARAHAKTILGAVAAGQHPDKERSRANSAMTIAQLVDLFISEHAKPKRKARTAADYAAVLPNHLVPRFGKRATDQLTPSDISQLRQGIVQRGTRLCGRICSSELDPRIGTV